MTCRGDRAPQAVQCIKTNVSSQIPPLEAHKILAGSPFLHVPRGPGLDFQDAALLLCLYIAQGVFQHGKRGDQKRGLANSPQLFQKGLTPA